MTDERQAVLDALRAEYIAVYAYGVVAAHASPERRALVAELTAAHRARRDATLDLLNSAGIPAPTPEPAYTVPFPVDGPVDAARLAETVEADAAVAWRAVVEQSTTERNRRLGVEALTESALRLARWQNILGTPSSALPGAV
ncbi:MAG TPA: ferritin-like domain-containing protein [Nocardia sp.]|uniref:ferritin-like domain-containing protein n=1 Tax=Nocardia TaxID=1817 RepID=UPI002455D2B4|nr:MULTISPECIES: ferritin-like domain-containing protein [Nocardia]HLS78178.1 ferritin-like domain-containing protein [Nocardia sp.]